MSREVDNRSVTCDMSLNSTMCVCVRLCVRASICESMCECHETKEEFSGGLKSLVFFFFLRLRKHNNILIMKSRTVKVKAGKMRRDDWMQLR